GALINNISKDSAADKSGFKVGDVILEFNGIPIITSGGLPPIVGNTMPNTEVDVEVFRDGKKISIVAILDELSDSTITSSMSSVSGEVEGVGFKVAGLSESDQQKTGETNGVLVKSISAKNVQRAGLRVGDVIKKIGKDEISSIKDFKKALKNRKDDEPLVLLIKQGVANRFIVIE
ncbi:MAG: PDZ domain-containing protein, partial [Proteobacteria bacterium]|nr:PDZ domain-containing protein [Pseudomonadota bacterium]